MKTFVALTIFLLISNLNSFAQSPSVLTQTEAEEDLKWLQFALEYTHPRLYKYDDKETVDKRFDNAHDAIKDGISGLDFLSLVSRLNASVNCGHLYTIPQAELREEVMDKKVMPFYIKLAGNDFYIFNDVDDNGTIPNGSKLVSINGKPISEIYDLISTGIATDGHIETRKRQLIERYFYTTFHGFDLYYHLHVDRASTFSIEYIEYGSDDLKSAIKQGISIDDKKQRLQKKYGLDQEEWFKTPSPRFNIVKEQN